MMNTEMKDSNYPIFNDLHKSTISFSDLGTGNPLLEFDKQFSQFIKSDSRADDGSATSHVQSQNVNVNVDDFEKYVTGEAVFNPAKYLSSSYVESSSIVYH